MDKPATNFHKFPLIYDAIPAGRCLVLELVFGKSSGRMNKLVCIDKLSSPSTFVVPWDLAKKQQSGCIATLHSLCSVTSWCDIIASLRIIMIENGSTQWSLSRPLFDLSKRRQWCSYLGRPINHKMGTRSCDIDWLRYMETANLCCSATFKLAMENCRHSINHLIGFKITNQIS